MIGENNNVINVIISPTVNFLLLIVSKFSMNGKVQVINKNVGDCSHLNDGSLKPCMNDDKNGTNANKVIIVKATIFLILSFLLLKN